MKAFVIALSIICAASAAVGQQIVPSRVKPDSDDITAKTAFERADALAFVISGKHLRPDQSQACLLNSALGGHQWSISGEGLSFTVHAKTGTVLTFSNSELSMRYQKGQYKPSAQKKFKSDAEALAHMNALATKLKFPSDLKATVVEYRPSEGRLEKGFATYGCQFRNPSGRAQAIMIIDASTGIVFDFWIASSRARG